MKFFDKFLAVTAGIIERALIKRMPTKLMPIVIVKAINDKSRSCIFAGEILSADAKSGATDEITKDFRYFKVIKIMKIEIIV